MEMFSKVKKESQSMFNFPISSTTNNFTKENGIGYSLAGQLRLGLCLPFSQDFI
jgi:hypothetical protein